MSDWEQTTLGAIAAYQNGYPFKPSELGGSKRPVIRIRQLLDEQAEVDYTDVDVPDRVLIDDGDLIFSWSATLASVVWRRGPAALNQHLFRVSPAPGVDKMWLHYCLDHAIDVLSTKTHGTTMKHVTKKVLEAHEVALPPLREQRRIVDVMAAVDAQVEGIEVAATQAGRLLDSLRSTVFNRRTDRVPFKEVAVLQRGFDLPVQSREPGNIPVIASNGQVGWHAQSAVAGPGVVTGRSGTIGKVMLITGDFWPLNTTLYVKDFKGNIPAFVRHLLAAMDLPGHAGGSTVPSLNRNVLDQVEVYCPDAHEQRVAASALDAVDALAGSLATEAARLREYRSSLLSGLLSQRFEVPESYDALLDDAVEVSA